MGVSDIRVRMWDARRVQPGREAVKTCPRKSTAEPPCGPAIPLLGII